MELRTVNDVFYINRLDFNYEYDMQRMTSVAPSLYNCPGCKTEYLAMLRIGLPQWPEKTMPMGLTGGICVAEIIQIDTAGGKRFVKVLEENKV